MSSTRNSQRLSKYTVNDDEGTDGEDHVEFYTNPQLAKEIPNAKPGSRSGSFTRSRTGSREFQSYLEVEEPKKSREPDQPVRKRPPPPRDVRPQRSFEMSESESDEEPVPRRNSKSQDNRQSQGRSGSGSGFNAPRSSFDSRDRRNGWNDDVRGSRESQRSSNNAWAAGDSRSRQIYRDDEDEFDGNMDRDQDRRRKPPSGSWAVAKPMSSIDRDGCASTDHSRTSPSSRSQRDNDSDASADENSSPAIFDRRRNSQQQRSSGRQPPLTLSRQSADDADGESIKTASFTEYSDLAHTEGVVLPRKSGRYDDATPVKKGPSSDSIVARNVVDNDDEGEADDASEENGASVSLIPYVLRCHKSSAKGGLVQCVVIRDRSSIHSKLYPTYELYLESNKKKLIIAMKMNMNRTSNYHLFDMTRGQKGSKLTKKSGNYLGKLRSRNMERTQYVLVNQAQDREEMAGVTFSRFGLVTQLKEGSLPRKMTVVVPHLDSNKMPIPNKTNERGEGSLLDAAVNAAHRGNRGLVFESKDPAFENGNYRLNFNGRVSVASVKNFQLVPSDNPNNVVCQFGKVGDDRFHLDFKTPLNAVQAFAFALAQFNL